MQERTTGMQKPCHFYLLPIGGTATAALAGLLHEAGDRVSGVDAALYPPTSEFLAELGIPVRLGFDPKLIPEDLDEVIIGNAVPRSNPEVAAVLDRGLPYTSQAAAFGERFCRLSRSIVVAGTHGKTTTTALATHILTSGGLDPSALIGGVPCGGRPWRLGHGGWTVVEGDEYNTAFFDRGPKFLHYHPHLFVVGNVEFDHGDIYPDLDAILAAFRAGTTLVGASGHVVANLGDGGARAVAEGHPHVVWYGLDGRAAMSCSAYNHSRGRLHATLRWEGREFDVETPLVGRHNLDDLMAAAACALLAGLAPETIAAAAATFPGVRRRLEVTGEAAGSAVPTTHRSPTAGDRPFVVKICEPMVCQRLALYFHAGLGRLRQRPSLQHVARFEHEVEVDAAGTFVAKHDEAGHGKRSRRKSFVSENVMATKPPGTSAGAKHSIPRPRPPAPRPPLLIHFRARLFHQLHQRLGERGGSQLGGGNATSRAAWSARGCGRSTTRRPHLEHRIEADRLAFDGELCRAGTDGAIGLGSVVGHGRHDRRLPIGCRPVVGYLDLVGELLAGRHGVRRPMTDMIIPRRPRRSAPAVAREFHGRRTAHRANLQQASSSTLPPSDVVAVARFTSWRRPTGRDMDLNSVVWPAAKSSTVQASPPSSSR